MNEREAFEKWYAENAFNYERDPIGSRECGLQWKGWQARAHVAKFTPDWAGYRQGLEDGNAEALAQPAQAVDVGVIREVIKRLEEHPLSDEWKVFDQCADKLTRALSGEKAGPVGKYRLLGPNDVIEPDDQFIDDNAVDWVRAGSASGGHLFIGMQYRLGVLKQARRPLPASPAPDKEVQP